MRHDGRVLKRRLAHEELVRQHAQTPQVHLFVVPVVLGARLDHLWRQVVESTAKRSAAVVGGVDAPPEIRNLDLAVDAHQNVLGLDVAVDDVLAVQVAQRRRHLGNVLGRLPLGEAVLLAQVLVQLALAGELEDQEDALAVVEVPVQLEDVGVPQVALDLNLAPHLLLHARAVLQLRLVEDLERADEVARPLARQVHAPELALAEGASDLKHAEVELFGCQGLVDVRGGFSFHRAELVGAAARRGDRLLARRGGGAGFFPLGDLGGEFYRGGDGGRVLRLEGDLEEVWPRGAVCELGCCDDGLGDAVRPDVGGYWSAMDRTFCFW